MVLRPLRTGLLRALLYTDYTPCATDDGDLEEEHVNLLDSPRLAAAHDQFCVRDSNPRPVRVSAVVMSKIPELKRRFRPWHAFAVLAAAIVITVVVTTSVLVTRRNHEMAIQDDKSRPSDPGSARVNLGYAQYQGSLVGASGGVAQYLGLRFAAPPTGERRWRAPADPEQDDNGDQAANAFGPVCLGIMVPYPNSLDQDEDCLFANVWAPANATVNSKLPVWLFIQGGGYTVNSNANWDGTAVVERSGRNIVMVNFNYRVGLWGFLASERVRAGGAGDLNAGLLDQRQVMRWVRRYIAQFGGDPNHVVIHGASAGAGSVALHLVAYGGGVGPDETENERLFIGAVGESVFFPAQPLVADLEWQFDRTLAAIGCENNNDPMGCLRGKDTATLQAANVPSAFPGRPQLPAPLFYWTPCVDGDFLRDLPYRLLEQGSFRAGVPVLMGATNDEGTVFALGTAAKPDDAALFLRNNYPGLSDTNANDVLERYPATSYNSSNDKDTVHGAWFPATAAAYGEATFVCPAAYVLDAYAGKGNKAWGYRTNIFDAVNAAQGLGVPHIWESWAVFGPDSQRGVGLGPASFYSYAADTVPLVMDYWLSFVRTLDPSALRTPGAPVWEAWSGGADDARSRLVFQSGNFTMEDVDPAQRRRCEFWRGLADQTKQ
ncbi:alpha/beta-hydrolase [Hypoxylon sp. FL1284]|nr:alpha/beta-hydrolase [Hypoxylon sp. FL1284]